ncbi:UDP-glucose--hexose-1-phosphate uridylyltransferase [Alteribacillus sp. HJP-4]|uniref:UDP-glucose--hexose-1-phosphate uridylyltransferase n=1 Tax=Alteribacillus sp. HJP-4 TaxID=2775394 RepID=UPI0035CCF0AB
MNMNQSQVCTWIESLVQHAGNRGMIAAEDRVYARNQIMRELRINDFVPDVSEKPPSSIPEILEKLEDYGVEERLIGQLLDEREQLSAAIMNVFIPQPSVVNERFYKKYEKNPEEATDYFYRLSQNSNYIQTKRISKNIQYKLETDVGELDITINLSKPEKDPKEIEKEKQLKKAASYPACLLCVENEGYPGRIGHPARSNHRTVRIALGGERWHLQYSPYVYYNEHCILLAEQHRDMKISKDTFSRLVGFVEKYPHYFMGSNADLPIVGGSILSHDHYQGGRYTFALEKAEDEFSFEIPGFSSIAASVVKWPMTVLRLRSYKKNHLIEAAERIRTKWSEYSDSDRDILAFSGETPHNTVTPIVRQKDGMLEIDLVLRNNRTSVEHPYGIFHPHEDVHHIKKENIGLIEVMGLAVLPKRLEQELRLVEKYLQGAVDTVDDHHAEWAQQLKETLKKPVDKKRASAIVREETGRKFLRVLEDAGVFKCTSDGREGLSQFISAL